ncbi:MAG: hypothetical protein IPK10_16735 [Bacteroidetes bacterium]|nr:hypothetical protein [Bacteroidota bacterium]
MQNMLALRMNKIEETFPKSLSFLSTSFNSISFLLLTLLILLKFEALSWGQISTYYLSLLVLQHTTLFSFETFCQHSILANPTEATTIWSDAIRVRFGIACLLVALLTILKIPFVTLSITAFYLILTIYNEAFKVAAKMEDKINSWSLISWGSILGAYGWIYFSKAQLQFLDLLVILTVSQGIRFVLLNFLFYYEYKLPLLPRTDFTQLKMSGRYFFRSSIVLLNYKIPFFFAVFLLSAIAMSSFHLLMLWTFVGYATVHQLGIHGTLNFNDWNRDALKDQSLKMLIAGTLMGLIWVGLGFVLSTKIPYAAISPWWMIPVFIILLFTCVQLPLLHALLKVKEEKKILQIYALSVFLQATFGYWFLSQQEITYCLWTLSVTAILQTLLYKKVLSKII